VKRALFVLVLLTLVGVVPQPPADAASPAVVRAVRIGRRRPPRHSQPVPRGATREVVPIRRGSLTDETPATTARRSRAQNAVIGAGAPSVSLDIKGLSFTGAVPPDPAGEVGSKQYVHTANTIKGARVLVLDKSTGAPELAFQMDSLATFGPCRSGIGDGMPIYDQFDGRWILTEIAASHNSLCIYVSDSDDAVTSTYTLYQIEFNVFPDYPKWAVWSNALYLGFNLGGFADPIVAFNLAKMIAGSPLTDNDVNVANEPRERGFAFQLLVPVDSDGPISPAPTEPGMFVRHVDDELNAPRPHDATHDFIEFFTMLPDFSSGNPTVTGPIDVPVSEFDSRLCRASFRCIPQHGTRVRLDSLREPMMNRPVMRIVNGVETLVGSFTVDVGRNRAGIRWFELTRPTPADPWTVEQDGTYAPRGLHRWVPSIDIDDAGDIALGFSASSGRTFPSVRITGRHSGDPMNEMTAGEKVLVHSGGPQTFADRWGDYTEMSVDPAPNAATFWYTNEYLNRRGEWRTRIASFTLP
jgi:hypothetical protein